MPALCIRHFSYCDVTGFHDVLWLWEGVEDAAGVAGGDDVGGDVAGDHAAGSDGGVVADGDTGEDGYVCADPHVVAHGDGSGVFESGVAEVYFEGMPGSVESAVGGYEYVVAECDRGFVKYDEVEVGKEVFTDMYVVAVVTVKRLLDDD